jgi:hypothetical protein
LKRGGRSHGLLPYASSFFSIYQNISGEFERSIGHYSPNLSGKASFLWGEMEIHGDICFINYFDFDDRAPRVKYRSSIFRISEETDSVVEEFPVAGFTFGSKTGNRASVNVLAPADSQNPAPCIRKIRIGEIN